MSSQGNLKLLITQSNKHVVFRVFQYFRTIPCKSPGYLGEDFAKLQAISPLTGPSMAKSPPSNSHKMLPVHKMPSPAQYKSSSIVWSFISFHYKLGTIFQHAALYVDTYKTIQGTSQSTMKPYKILTKKCLAPTTIFFP
jgi:hypothetical protein